ncbi:MAG: 23S rRNA (adenine(1618)-N(6))-methyltransferase RlmF [Planctomycetes bacterium]|nr:23S rRNA (adenine(1618)-N(6))-methyltransferase RlmF [Planctomycetota bacterium]
MATLPRPSSPQRTKGRAATAPKSGMHPRNPHRQRYDFVFLTAASPGLGRFVSRNRYGDDSIDFADARAVKALNQAILKHVYGVSRWDIPDGYLCPPIPGRADYIHHVADLLAGSNGGTVPRGADVRVLDIGVGANCVYPIIGRGAYGWSFIGSDIDPVAIASAQRIVRANAVLTGHVEIRRQASALRIVAGVLAAGETCDVAICNPPFHASQREAQEGTRRKWRNLGKAGPTGAADARNFGGQGAELWCAGGEVGFVQRMIADSARLPTACRWYTTLLSKASSLAAVERALTGAGAVERRVIALEQGQKKSRIVAWSFFGRTQRDEWRVRLTSHR